MCSGTRRPGPGYAPGCGAKLTPSVVRGWGAWVRRGYILTAQAYSIIDNVKAVLHDKVQRQVGNVAQAFALDHRVDRILGIVHTQLFHRIQELVQREMVDLIYVARTQRNGRNSIWGGFSRNDHNMR